MAGSLNHIVDGSGRFRMDLIENLGDAHEALEECFHVIRVLSGGSVERVNAALRELKCPGIHGDHDEYDPDSPAPPLLLVAESPSATGLIRGLSTDTEDE